MVRRSRMLPVLALTAALTLVGCGAQNPSSQGVQSGSTNGGSDAPSSTAPAVPKAALQTNLASRTNVPVDTLVNVKSTHSSLDSVTISSTAGAVAGGLNAGSWTATQRLEPGSTYTIKAQVTTDQGAQRTLTQRFTTQDLTLNQQTFASVTPLGGQTVGIGMPVIVHFDIPVTDKAAMQQQMHVTSNPPQKGSWNWISSTEAHWRPAKFWQAHTQVSVNLDVNGVKAGPDLWGQSDRHIDFTVGNAMISKVNTVTDEMRTYENGKLVRVTPITTGQQPQYTTRSGIKVIVEKYRRVSMNSETVGIDPNGPNGYNLKGVEFAMRLTFSGEFLHAAPWSVASQGHANVSHGCTGMSTANAQWMYDHSSIGDVVEYTGTTRPMTLTNGYGDWNESFATYAHGSAL